MTLGFRRSTTSSRTIGPGRGGHRPAVASPREAPRFFRWRRRQATASFQNPVSFRHLPILLLLLGFAPCPAAEPLRTLREIQALPDDEARGGRRVSVEAVLLYVDPSRGDSIIYDGTAACYNFLNFSAAGRASHPGIGDRVRFDGFTVLTGFTPHMESRAWTILGRGEIPEPYRLTADEIYQPRPRSRSPRL